MRPTDVFTPNDYPQHTYVQRDEEDLEQRLRDALEIPGQVISIAGPSKSGKTVLVERVIGAANIITINGATLSTGDMLWDRVLDKLEEPNSTSVTNESGASANAEVSGESTVGFLGVAQGKLAAKTGTSVNDQQATSMVRSRRGMDQVVELLRDSSLVVFIDDFHYILDAKVQRLVARNIKAAAGNGVKIITASVPYRADDVVRANPELRGRLRVIDTKAWGIPDLKLIGQSGFPLLHIEVNDADLEFFARESSGTPQLMQAICLQLCFSLNRRDAGLEPIALTALEVDFRRWVLEEVSRNADFSSLVREMHEGPRTRGVERKLHRLSDGTDGDVYRAVLLALAADPPLLEFSAREVGARISRVCIGEQPQNASIIRACHKIAAIAIDQGGDERVLDWSDEDETLEIADPYFLFYLRWSNRLNALGQ